MSQPPENQDDLDAALRRMESEFGRRPSAEGAEDPPPPARPGPGPAPGSGAPPPFGPPPPAPPQGVRIRPASRPVATWILIGAIGVIYVLSCLLSGSLFQPDLQALVLLGAKVNPLIAQGELWRLVTATFLHGNLIHIFFNGYALYALGPESERIFGTPRFLAVYFLSGVGGSVGSYLFSPAPSVGASGAIFGLVGALGLFFYLNREALGQAARAQVQNIVAIGFINLLIGFASPGVIDNFGHLGGLALGLAAGFALAPRIIVDARSFPPAVARSYPRWGWAAAAALAVALFAVAALVPGAGV
jgi:rhomboid protease GluP